MCKIILWLNKPKCKCTIRIEIMLLSLWSLSHVIPFFKNRMQNSKTCALTINPLFISLFKWSCTNISLFFKMHLNYLLWMKSKLTTSFIVFFCGIISSKWFQFLFRTSCVPDQSFYLWRNFDFKRIKVQVFIYKNIKILMHLLAWEPESPIFTGLYYPNSATPISYFLCLSWWFCSKTALLSLFSPRFLNTMHYIFIELPIFLSDVLKLFGTFLL